MRDQARTANITSGNEASEEKNENINKTSRRQTGQTGQAGAGRSYKPNEVISDCDTVKEILSKLEGTNLLKEDGNESEGISEELENAFQNLNLSNQGWDEGTQI